MLSSMGLSWGVGGEAGLERFTAFQYKFLGIIDIYTLSQAIQIYFDFLRKK